MFAKLKEKLTGSVNKFSGRKDFLEAVCAASALIAAADGEVEDKEIEMAIKTVSANPNLSGGFPAREIELTMEGMLRRAQAGRTGRMGLYKEIDDIASDAEMAEVVYLTALDVSESDGEMEPEEKEVLKKIADRLHIDQKKYEV